LEGRSRAPWETNRHMQRLIVPILVALAVFGAALFWIVPPISQPPVYQDFADQRLLFGIPNFWNVISNIPFLIIGGWGILYLSSGSATEGLHDGAERWMFLFFFATVALTGLGSSYYHWAPGNARLVWDRLPLAMMFMTLFVIIIAEWVNRRAGVWLFFPLLLLGVATVWYWYLTETRGRGDLRPYLLTQIYPVFAIPVIFALAPKKYTRTEYLYSAIAWYVGAKLYEVLDKPVFSLGHIVSGHTLKHLGAGVSCYMILSWLRHRRLITTETLDIPWPVADSDLSRK
jgi:hypothetical protein